MCEFRTKDGGCAKTNRPCVETGCVLWEQASEARYQMYIDDLHRQIDEQLGIITELTDRLEKYETAMVNAFLKWSEANANK